MELSVVIPTYNERENIKVLVPKIQSVFKENNIDGEIIIVDDNSTDGTKEEIYQLSRENKNVRIKIRGGKKSLSKSWMEGFEMAQKEIVVCIDADLCHDPKYFPLMLEKMNKYDIVIGSRYLISTGQPKMEGKSFFPIFVSEVGQKITRFCTGFTQTDTSHSFRMFKKKVFEDIKNCLRYEGNVFLIEFLYFAVQKGYKVTEIPIIYGKRIYGKTKLSVLKEGLRYLYHIFQLRFRRC
ncbi:MAG: polyprenol monophosphomannose synthase [Elusimicrobiota bacterium]